MVSRHDKLSHSPSCIHILTVFVRKPRHFNEVKTKSVPSELRHPILCLLAEVWVFFKKHTMSKSSHTYIYFTSKCPWCLSVCSDWTAEHSRIPCSGGTVQSDSRDNAKQEPAHKGNCRSLWGYQKRRCMREPTVNFAISWWGCLLRCISGCAR